MHNFLNTLHKYEIDFIIKNQVTYYEKKCCCKKTILNTIQNI